MPSTASRPAAVPNKLAEEGRAAPGEDQLRIAGITPFTTIDFPGKLAAVAFLQGCPWKCVYCQNVWMQPRDFDPAFEHSSWAALRALLMRRQGLLDGVVFSGGEPCLDPALPAAVKAVKALGYAVGLHTGGAYPRRLAEIIGDLDWIGLDVKAPPDDDAHWTRIVQVEGASARWAESFEIVRASGVPFECRTTAHPDFLSEASLLRLADRLADAGADTFALQLYRRPPGQQFALFPAVGSDYPSPELEEALRARFANFTIRRG